MSQALPSEPAALAAALPDVPRWIYARSVLLSGAARVRVGAVDAALILDPTTAVLVGRPDPELLRGALTGGPRRPALLVQEDAWMGVRATLPSWTSRPFVVHGLPRPYSPDAPPAPGVVVSAPLDPAVLVGLPDDVRADAADAPAAAVRVIDGVPVAVCAVSDMTETLWDVGIDTVESARRQGHATVVFGALAAAMAAHGRQPVWAAYEDDAPSLRLAARLGFRPVARMIELTPPGPWSWPGPCSRCRRERWFVARRRSQGAHRGSLRGPAVGRARGGHRGQARRWCCRWTRRWSLPS